jgi:hypothetical protein
VSLLIQDGRRGGHLRWARDAIIGGQAEGLIISPFHTPRVKVPYHSAGSTVVGEVVGAGGKALFDPTTHARLLPSSDDLTHYETWGLWGPAGVGLDTDTKRLQHIERVFARQSELSVSALAPTLTLDSPLGVNAIHATRTAELARGLNPECCQAIAGRRSFWGSGADLDVYIGQLTSLRAPCWALTVVNELVDDNVPDLGDTDAFTGLLRTVHSLSERSRVILCHADYAGLPAVAAGASDLGCGWDRGMRYFDPRSFQLTSDGIRIPASYVTQGQLGAVLRRDTADAIARLGEPLATTLRGGAMPVDDGAERSHHLRQLHNVVDTIDSNGHDRAARVRALREFYEQAQRDYTSLLSRLPRSILNDRLRERWLDEPLAVLKHYAVEEGLWNY